MEDILLIRREGAIATLIMNRPESRNALNGALLTRLAEGVAEVVADPEVRVIVLTGAGSAFCAGGDLKQGGDDVPRNAGKPPPMSAESRIARLRAHMDAARLLHQTSKPTIAMMRGGAAGAGLSLAAACDLRIAADTAVLMTAFVPHGFSGDFGGTYFWTHILGVARARELYLLSEKFDARRALAFGLVNRVVGDDELEAVTMGIAQELAQRLPSALHYIKRNLNLAVGSTLEQMLDAEATHMVLSTAAAIAAHKARSRGNE